MRRSLAAAAVSAVVATMLPVATASPAAASTAPTIEHPADGSTVDQGALTVRGSVNDSASEKVHAMYVVDVSGSTGAAGYDCNGDGTVNADDDINADGSNGEILDCEVAGVIALNSSIAAIPGANSSIKVGLVAFGSYAAAADAADHLSGRQSFIAPLADDDDPDRQRTADIVQVAASLNQGVVNLFQRYTVGTGTNFTPALNVAFDELQQVDGRKIVFLLSDGYGSLSDTVLARMDALGIEVRPFAVGTGSDRCREGGSLDRIGDRSGVPCVYTQDPSGLSAALTEAPKDIDRVEVSLDGGAPVRAVVDTLGGYSAEVFASSGQHTVVVRVFRTDGSVTSATSSFTASSLGTAYVSLGDSYSAGEGITPFAPVPGADGGCHQSTRAYATVVGTPDYELSNGQSPVLNNVACSGAVLKNLIGIEQNARGERHGVQIEAVDASADLISFTIGGNDVAFSEVVKHCATQFDCKNDGFVRLNSGKELTLDEYLTARLRLLEPELNSFYRRLRERSGNHATIVALNYPELFDDGNALRLGCKEAALFSKGEREYLNDRVGNLRDAIARQAANAGVFAADVIDTFKGKRVCDGGVNDNGEWIVGHEAVAGLAGDGSFHPNVNGARGYAQVLTEFLDAQGGPTNASGLPRNPEPTMATSSSMRLASSSQRQTSSADLSPGELEEIAALEFGILDVTRLSDLRGEQVCPTNRLGTGEQVVLSGHGFAPGSAVDVLLKSESESAPRTFASQVVTDAAGSFRVSLVVPFDLAPSAADAADDWQTALRIQADGRTADGAGRRLSEIRAIDAAAGACTAAVAAAGDQAGLGGSPAPNAAAQQAPAQLLVEPVGARLDVVPTSRANEIEAGSNQVFDVALLSSPAFDATVLRHSKMRLGNGNGQTPMGSTVVDVNGDGLQDLLLRHMAQQTGLTCADRTAALHVDDARWPHGTFTVTDRVTMTGCEPVTAE